MRLKSDIFVSALIRRAQVEGAYAVMVRRGAEEAGAIFVKVSRLDGTAALYGPAPQSAFDDSFPADRKFAMIVEPGRPEADADARLVRELKFDPDIYVVDIEDRAGRHFLDLVTP
ncbi:DUF1491 family protein [Xanthobacter dioxanivorans]|uniref:DUF1491 family protein n=1 Tax=Xanthobacter dioxanivorans TaxID=2528964 RepID=A0A974PN63_9HYPH|nr:DUF1491 family protein [Xanthobacter dioxanivorans]QRG06363.1 DUF1491 family protein [Xanthobacter dioxanivorans]